MAWDALWTRKQRFMDMLADYGNRILYVEPMSNVVCKIRSPELVDHSGLKTQIRQIKKNLFVLTPPLMLPAAHRNRFIFNINQQIFLRILKAWQRKLSLFHPILWMYTPFVPCLVGQMGEKWFVYNCTDDFTAFKGMNKPHLVETQEALIKTADIVLVSAQGLLETHQLKNPNTFLIPNGVDFSHFAQAQEAALPLPSDVENITRPRLGFVGAIQYWIDLDLIKQIATAKPDWSIVMVGPVGAGIDLTPFKPLSNVHFLGSKSLKTVPQYLKAFDVCLNTFKQTQLTKTVNPLKIYEYLAAGKPIVSTEMPAISHLSSVVRFAKSYDEFLSHLEDSLKENDPALTQARMDIARQYDWRNLLEEACTKILECLNRKQNPLTS